MRCDGCWTVFDAYLSLSPHSPLLEIETEGAAKETSVPMPLAAKPVQGAGQATLEALDAPGPQALPIIPGAHRRAPRVIDVPQAPFGAVAPAEKRMDEGCEEPMRNGASCVPVVLSAVLVDPVVETIAPRGPLKARRILPLSKPDEAQAGSAQAHAMGLLERSGLMDMGGRERAGAEACLHGIENGGGQEVLGKPALNLVGWVVSEGLGHPEQIIQAGHGVERMSLPVHEAARIDEPQGLTQMEGPGASSKAGADDDAEQENAAASLGLSIRFQPVSEPSANPSIKDAAHPEPVVFFEEPVEPIERRGPLKARRVEWGGLDVPEVPAVGSGTAAVSVSAGLYAVIEQTEEPEQKDGLGGKDLATEALLEPEFVVEPTPDPKRGMFTRGPWSRSPGVPSTALERARLRARSAEEVELHERGVVSAKANRAKNVFAAGGSLLLALALVSQVGYSQRYEAYSRGPALRPMLESMCRAMGCKVGFVLAKDALSLEGADVRLDANGRLVFSGSLKNAASYESKAPRLWVSIEGEDGESLASRIYEPSEWLGAESIKAGSEREARMALRPLSQSPSGYKAELVFDPAPVPGKSPI